MGLWEHDGNVTDGATYPQKPLQELPGAVDVDAGDVAVAPQHAIHCGGHGLPVLLGLGVKLQLILHHLTRHGGRGARARVGLAAPPRREKPPVRPNKAPGTSREAAVSSEYPGFYLSPLPQGCCNPPKPPAGTRRNKDLNPDVFWRTTKPESPPWAGLPRLDQASWSLAQHHTQLHYYCFKADPRFSPILPLFSLCLNVLEITAYTPISHLQLHLELLKVLLSTYLGTVNLSRDRKLDTCNITKV